MAGKLVCRGCGQEVQEDELGADGEAHYVELPFEVALSRGYPFDPCGPVEEVED